MGIIQRVHTRALDFQGNLKVFGFGMFGRPSLRRGCESQKLSFKCRPRKQPVSDLNQNCLNFCRAVCQYRIRSPFATLLKFTLGFAESNCRGTILTLKNPDSNPTISSYEKTKGARKVLCCSSETGESPKTCSH